MASNVGEVRDLTRVELFLWLTIVLTVFSLLCFATSAALNYTGRNVLSKQVAATGGVIGPISAPSANQSYHVGVASDLPSFQTWKFVSIDVLDEKKEFLFAFGSDLWKQSGYDGGEYWSEWVTQFDHKFTLKEPGNYYLQVNVDVGSAEQRVIKVRVRQLTGSSLAHLVLAIFAGIAAIVCGWIYYESY